MEISQTEMKALQTAAGGETRIKQIAARLGISLKQAYRVCNALEQKGLWSAEEPKLCFQKLR